MFSAISSYFFGGDKVPTSNEEPENSIVYQTIEADDWLLVDVSDPEDGNKENLEIEQNVENSMIVLSERHKVEVEEDEDDVLTALPFLLPMDAPSTSSSKRRRRRKISSSAHSESDLEKRRLTLLPIGPVLSYDKLEEPGDELIKPPSEEVCLQLFREYIEVQRRRFMPLLSMPNLMISSSPKIVCKRKPTSAIAKKSKQEKADKRNIHPAEMPVSRGPIPTLPTVEIKGAYTQHIKLLKHAQLAKELVVKKRQKRSHFNRQNKAYLFDSSNKHQHRRDLWQNHSGANNNRKCC